MLRSFRLANHKSIREEVELLLLPIYHLNWSAVPVAAIYGANASGKSNLLDGLRFMRAAVLGSYPRWEPNRGVPRQPFRLDSASRSGPSHYVVEIELGGIRYTYGFVINDEIVLEEWLHSYPEKRRRIVFERFGGDIKFGSTVSAHRSRTEVLEELTRPNALFLSVASRVNLAELLSIYEWFQSALLFRDTGSMSVSLLSPDYFDDMTVDFLVESPNRRRLVRDLLRVADTGIIDFRLEASSLPRVPTRRLVFLHKGFDAPFELADESSGTRTWIELLRDGLAVLESGGVLIVDEIDTSLHPWLTARLLALFQEDSTNPQGAQLICTSHDTTLLGPTLDDPVLRRDQVWFTEKDDRGGTSLYPLSDFKPRKGENTARRYLGGSYGAVPKLFPEDFVDAVRLMGSDGEA